METVEIIVAVVVGFFAIIGGLYKFFNWVRGKETSRTESSDDKECVDTAFEYAVGRMAELLAEMKADLQRHPLCREFILPKW